MSSEGISDVSARASYPFIEDWISSYQSRKRWTCKYTVNRELRAARPMIPPVQVHAQRRPIQEQVSDPSSICEYFEVRKCLERLC